MSYDLGFDLDVAIERQKLSRKNIALLKEAIIPLTPATITEKQLALFLDACNGSVEDTKKVIQVYFQARKTSPEHFNKRIPHSDEIQQCLDNQDYFYLPPTRNGFPIIFHRLSNSKPSNYNIDSAIKTFFMTIDACLYKLGPRPGIIFIFDMKEVRFGHLTRARIGSIKKFFHYLQEGLPGKLCQIHILNVVSFFDKIISLIKPFMRAEIFKSLYTYQPDMNLEEFHKNWVPKECLPSDFGGDLPTVVEMHQAFRKELADLTEYFIAEEEQRTSVYAKVDKKSKKSIEETSDHFGNLEID